MIESVILSDVRYSSWQAYIQYLDIPFYHLESSFADSNKR